MASHGGELRLTLAPDDSGRTVAREQFHSGALRVIRPFYLDGDGTATYMVVNPGGGYLTADHYRMAITAKPGARVRLSAQSATKVYRTPEGAACQETHVCVGEGAVVENLPQPIIVYRNGSFLQRTIVNLHPSGSFLSGEIITPGWAPDGSWFQWSELRQTTEVWVAGAPLVIDRLRLVPQRDDAADIAVMAGLSHAATFLVAKPGAVALHSAFVAAAEEAEATGVRSGVGLVAETGEPSALVVRSLGRDSQQLRAFHERLAELVRGHPVNLREL